MTYSRTLLETIAKDYLHAYRTRAPQTARLSSTLRYTENCAELEFPDGTWDTVTQERGPALIVTDGETGQIGIFTSIMQLDTPGFLAVRLKVEDGRISEIEHIISTSRNLSGPPTPIGEIDDFSHNPDLEIAVPQEQRCSREELIGLANGYFDTLENNTGEIRNTAFTKEAVRFENGKAYGDVEARFLEGWYRFNDRVRDREHFLVDEERGLVMSRGFIDHKGVLDEYTLTTGETKRSIFREPHSWSFLELFKIRDGRITAIEATFIAVPYFLRSPWTKASQRAST